MVNKNLKQLGLMLPLLVVLLSGSSCASKQLSAAAVTPAIPSLPSSARQPKQIPECVPSCSGGLERSLNSMLESPTKAD